MNFEINLTTVIKSFFLQDQKVKKKINKNLENEISF